MVKHAKNIDYDIVCPVRYPIHLESINIKSNDVIFVQLRNPFDTLISEYYSFGFTHPPNGDSIENGEIISVNVRRQYIKKHQLGLDDYCLKYADHLIKRYEHLIKVVTKLKKNRCKVIPLYYSDMMLNFEDYFEKLCKHIKIDKTTKNAIYLKYKGQFTNFRPLNDNNIVKNRVKSHRRNGIPGEYKNKLKKQTLEVLIHKFAKYYSSSNVADRRFNYHILF